MRAQYKHLTTMPQNTASIQTVPTLWCLRTRIPFSSFGHLIQPLFLVPVGVNGVPSFFWIYMISFQIQSNSFPSYPGVTIACVPSKMGTEPTRNPDSQTPYWYVIFFFKNLSTCTYMSLFSSCIVFPKKSILIHNTVSLCAYDLVIIFSVLQLGSHCPTNLSPVSRICNAHCGVIVTWTIHFFVHIHVSFANYAFPLSSER